MRKSGLAKVKVAEVSDETFERASDLFSMLSAPMRLRIIQSVCDSEKSASEILREVKSSQPNLSQHLNALYRVGILGRRRDGIQIYYRVIDQRVTEICHAVCDHVSVAADEHG